MNRAPVERDAREPRARNRGGERLALVRAVVERVGEFAVGVFRDALARELRKRLAGAGLDEHAVFFAGQKSRRIGEPHGRAQMLRPVIRIGRLLVGHPFSGDARHDRQRRSVKFHAAHGLGEQREHRPDHRRMEGVRGREAARGDVAFVKNRLDFFDRVERAGQDAELRRVDRRDVHAAGAKLARLGLGKPRGEHRAAGLFLHEPGACRDEARGVLGRKNTRERGGGELADAVAEQRERLHAERKPQFSERVIHRENRGLREARLAQSRLRIFIF